MAIARLISGQSLKSLSLGIALALSAGGALAQQPASPTPASPTPASPAASAPKATPAAATTPAAPAPAKPTAATPAAPKQGDAKATIEAMQGAAPKPAGVAPATQAAKPRTAATTGSPPAAASGGRLLREGSFITMRRGRIIKALGDDWQFHFDNGPDNRADAPMTLMPCLNLQAIEMLAERGGESLSFTLSGQVFVYKGRNYLLPSLYTVNRRGDVNPAQ